jgi:hypothetical protein
MAIWIPPFGRMLEVFPKDPAKGFSPDELVELLADGCKYPDIYQLADGRRMVFDGEGRLKGLPFNVRATVFYAVGRPTGWGVVGNVVIGSPAEVQ